MHRRPPSEVPRPAASDTVLCWAGSSMPAFSSALRTCFAVPGPAHPALSPVCQTMRFPRSVPISSSRNALICLCRFVFCIAAAPPFLTKFRNTLRIICRHMAAFVLGNVTRIQLAGRCGCGDYPDTLSHLHLLCSGSAASAANSHLRCHYYKGSRPGSTSFSYIKFLLQHNWAPLLQLPGHSPPPSPAPRFFQFSHH